MEISIQRLPARSLASFGKALLNLIEKGIWLPLATLEAVGFFELLDLFLRLVYSYAFGGLLIAAAVFNRLPNLGVPADPDGTALRMAALLLGVICVFGRIAINIGIKRGSY